MFTEGFGLGLAASGGCLGVCGTALVPWLLGRGRSVASNAGAVALFLAGRLAVYLLLGLLAFALGRPLAVRMGTWLIPVRGVVYVSLAALLLRFAWPAFRPGPERVPSEPGTCPAARATAETGWVPIIAGVAMGLGLCPPLALAFARALEAPSLTASLGFFLAFFAGSSILLVVIPWVGLWRRIESFRLVGRFAAGLAGVWYLLRGMILLRAAAGNVP